MEFCYGFTLRLGAYLLARDSQKITVPLTGWGLIASALVLAGYTNKAIAAQICISEKTVEFHLDHIYSKLGVRTRLMAGVWALQQGMGTEPRGIPG